MNKKSLEVSVSLQIQKPPHEVFEAIVDPSKMTQYFISKSSGRLEEGKVIMWRFPEFDFEFPIRVGELTPDEYISYYWDVDSEELLVEMKLVKGEDDSTIVYVTEKSRENDDAGIKWLISNTEGWANCLACLKAYLEYGINLRKGSFTYRKP